MLPVADTLCVPSSPADTPIEEFNPTPAFPALQYLESVDEDGVAWQAGLRTGDFLIEVGSYIQDGHMLYCSCLLYVVLCGCCAGSPASCRLLSVAEMDEACIVSCWGL
ncbi:hypothetical protein GDO81_004006 [Engystomops pustulosus]|uniref:PDZ domain-containing protein n=1 Tax=Engystomops pustulosus TaxID=76066 RepID=A0AAV6ZVE2_ENGPU|nr:hypothetical protein GDO81_004006 [Engystomops pustulosus]